MANEELLTVLKQGAEAWNAWRAGHGEAALDLSGAGLRARNLDGANLADADLRNADLRGTVLTNSNLVGACLRGANLFKAVLDNADLRNADLRGAQFLHCPQLQATHNWETAFRDEDLACGAPVPKPNP